MFFRFFWLSRIIFRGVRRCRRARALRRSARRLRKGDYMVTRKSQPVCVDLDVKQWLYRNLCEEAGGDGYDLAPDSEWMGLPDADDCIVMRGWLLTETPKAYLVGFDTLDGSYDQDRNAAWRRWVPKSQIYDIRFAG